jgi:hypothetical protein
MIALRSSSMCSAAHLACDLLLTFQRSIVYLLFPLPFVVLLLLFHDVCVCAIGGIGGK